MLGQKNGMFYELDAGPSVLDSQNTALITSNGQPKLSIAESRMWHRRLGHPGEAAIKSSVKGYVDDGRICEVCIQAKLKRKIIRVPVQRTTTPFELVHSDLCGPFAVRSSGGAQKWKAGDTISGGLALTTEVGNTTTKRSEASSPSEVLHSSHVRDIRNTRTASRKG